jgi:hypothetical protein
MRCISLPLVVGVYLANLIGATASKPSTFPDLHDLGEVQVYRRVQTLPRDYKEMLRKALDEGALIMAEPGTPYRTGDVVSNPREKRLPTRRLIFAAGSDKLRFFYYEVGGYGGGGATVLVFRCDPSKRCDLIWTGVDLAATHAKTPAQLLRRIQRHKLEPFDRR